MLYDKETINTICSVSRETLEKIQSYHDLLLKWQKAINLISSNTVSEIWHRHIADSMQVLEYIPAQTKSIADLGSGGGLPAIILAILCKDKNNEYDFHITLIESDKKKCMFLQECIRVLNLNANVINERIESVSGDFDLATARALASTDKLLEMCQNLQIEQCLLQKGEKFQQEIDKTQQSWQVKYTRHPSKTAEKSYVVAISKFSKNN